MSFSRFKKIRRYTFPIFLVFLLATTTGLIVVTHGEKGTRGWQYDTYKRSVGPGATVEKDCIIPPDANSAYATLISAVFVGNGEDASAYAVFDSEWLYPSEPEVVAVTLVNCHGSWSIRFTWRVYYYD